MFLLEVFAEHVTRLLARLARLVGRVRPDVELAAAEVEARLVDVLHRVRPLAAHCTTVQHTLACCCASSRSLVQTQDIHYDV